MAMHRSGILFVISAPSGAGKTTLCDNLRATQRFVYSVSCTTRAPRKGETNGQDYHFLAPDLFKKRVDEGFFIEHATVHGNSYGTPLEPIKHALSQGRDVLLDIDVQGARQIRSQPDLLIGRSLVDVFLMTETFAILEKRLHKRGTDDEVTIQRRLAGAREEMSHWQEYAYVILSASAQDDVDKFNAIYQAELYRTSRITLDLEAV